MRKQEGIPQKGEKGAKKERKETQKRKGVREGGEGRERERKRRENKRGIQKKGTRFFAFGFEIKKKKNTREKETYFFRSWLKIPKKSFQIVLKEIGQKPNSFLGGVVCSFLGEEREMSSSSSSDPLAKILDSSLASSNKKIKEVFFHESSLFFRLNF